MQRILAPKCKYYSSNFFRLAYLSIFLCLLGKTDSSIAVSTSIVPDGTLPNNSVVVGANGIVTITGGTTAGNNIFHSFSTFNLGDETGSTSTFQVNNNIVNILVRVTGNQASYINGTLKTTGGNNPNLFFMNPNGITFGPEASLSVGGSFTATTANKIVFGGLGSYSANPDSQDVSLLTINPSALFYNKLTNPGTITVNQSNLSVSDGQELNLIGGDVNINGNDFENGSIQANFGLIQVGGLANNASDQSIVINADGKLSYPSNQNLSNISLDNGAYIYNSAGNITLTANNIYLDNGAYIENSGGSASNAGNITLTANNIISLDNASYIFNSGGSASNTGNITLTANNISLDSASYIFNFGGSTYNSGNITLTANNISLDNGASIYNYGGSDYNSGNITLTANNISLDNGASIENSGGSDYNSGNITLTANNISLDNISAILNQYSSFQGTGNVYINAVDNLTVSNQSLISSAISEDGKGSFAGDIYINTKNLNLINSAAIDTGTLDQGNAGNININVNGAINISGIGRNGKSSEISTNSGQAWTIVYKTVNFKGGSKEVPSSIKLVSNPAAQGNAGNLNITASSLSVNDGGKIASTNSTGGNGGNININLSGLLLLQNNSEISTTSGTFETGGNGGNINIKAQFIVGLDNSTISANAFSGNGGNINITTNGIFGIAYENGLNLPFGAITASSQYGSSGTVNVNLLNQSLQQETALPNNPVDTSEILSQPCQGSTLASNDKESEFTVTGKGGLPNNPDSPLASESTLAPDWIRINPHSTSNKINNKQTIKKSENARIIEATGVKIDANGDIELTGDADNTNIDNTSQPVYNSCKGAR